MFFVVLTFLINIVRFVICVDLYYHFFYSGYCKLCFSAQMCTSLWWKKTTTFATPGNVFKQPGGKNGENNLNNRDSYTPQEKVRFPVQQAFFLGRWDSAEANGVPNKRKGSRANQGRSRSKTRKSRKRKYRGSSSSSSSSLTSSSPSRHISKSETSSSFSSSDSERMKRKKSKKKKSKKDKTKK